MKRASFLSFLLTVSLIAPAFASSGDGFSYAGLEYFGSSQLSRDELESMLHLRPGSSETAIDKAVENLKIKIDKRRLMANIQTVLDPPDKVFVVFDIVDPTSTTAMPTRVLVNPHHVMTKSEKPAMLLKQLRDRIIKLDEEGRKWSDSYPQGVRIFTDEAANRLVTELRRFGPVLRSDWLEVVSSDPDPQLRCDAIELLNWGGEYADTCANILPAIDDTDHNVRGSVVRFIYPRLQILPDNFPWVNLAAGLCRQLKRPSHEDRSKSMFCLMALMKLKPELIEPIKRTCGNDVKRISEESRISNLKQTARNMLIVFSQPVPKAPIPEQPEPGF